ncbi:SAM hydrolase/SAM-dependent halogenase family protein [Capillimicrobium parvum]|uniref:Adenosyl-chloride synthase n=1 Tax=Capillimicrobium parvum TaxID=2884022 RepID=A0A9E7C7B4_9ACTN|nr:SAM-dependent chlorinase/fluorinase [Capillimicrobium parvum]UGS39252.1 Adenosyl-chloride synthase [Capillimicrobium parvum]
MFVTFLSDYGEQDEFVGVCRGVLAGLAPAARVIDVTHGIARHDVRAGALVLRNALPYMPAGVHLAVVDPQVGGARRGVAVACADEERTLVGPDNGLLMLAAERFGGAIEAVDVSRSPWRLEPVSATFHGRDIFAPVAAALARGEPLAAAGEPCAVEELMPLMLPSADRRPGALAAHVLLSDRFGNVILDGTHDDLTAVGLRLGDEVEVVADGRAHRGRFASTFADVDVGALLLYEDAQRQIALAVNRGSALRELRLGRDDELLLRTC